SSCSTSISTIPDGSRASSRLLPSLSIPMTGSAMTTSATFATVARSRCASRFVTPAQTLPPLIADCLLLRKSQSRDAHRRHTIQAGDRRRRLASALYACHRGRVARRKSHFSGFAVYLRERIARGGAMHRTHDLFREPRLGTQAHPPSGTAGRD